LLQSQLNAAAVCGFTEQLTFGIQWSKCASHFRGREGSLIAQMKVVIEIPQHF
jgi:hypothetical protein